jgi:2-iminobutanoate/2-iminopropanoate deaminase
MNELAEPAPIGPYSQAIRAGSTLYCAGQVPLDPKIGQLVSGSIVDQTRRALDSLFAVLGAAQLSADNVVKTTVFLIDMGDFPAMNEVYARYFPRQAPARTTVQVSALPRGARIEIDAIAVAKCVEKVTAL